MSKAPLSETSDPRDSFFDVTDLNADLGRQTGRSASVILLFSCLRIALTLVTTGILARFVPPEEQGRVAVVIPVILIAAGLSEFGLPQAIMQRQTITHRVVSALFWVNIALGLILTAAAALMAPLATKFYDTPEVLLIMIILSPYILLTVTSATYVAILRRGMRIRVAETCNLIGLVLASTVAILAAILGAGSWALVVQMLVAQGASLFCFVIAVRWRPSAPWHSDLGAARSALVFGGYLSLDRLLNGVIASLPTVIIGRTFDSSAAGFYYRSMSFAEMPGRRLVGPLAGAFLPSLSRLQSESEFFCNMYIRQVTRGNLIMIPVGLTICLAPDMLVSVLLGGDWVLAIPVLGWLGARPLMALFASANTWVMIAMGKPKELFQARVYSSIFILIAMVGAARLDLVNFVAVFVIAQVIVNFFFMPFVIIRHTPIKLSTVRQAIAADVLFCLVVSVVAGGGRQAVELSPLIEGVAVGSLICSAQAIRILLTPQYKEDLRKLLQR